MTPSSHRTITVDEFNPELFTVTCHDCGRSVTVRAATRAEAIKEARLGAAVMAVQTDACPSCIRPIEGTYEPVEESDDAARLALAQHEITTTRLRELKDFVSHVESGESKHADRDALRLRNAVLAIHDARVDFDLQSRRAHASRIVGSFLRGGPWDEGTLPLLLTLLRYEVDVAFANVSVTDADVTRLDEMRNRARERVETEWAVYQATAYLILRAGACDEDAHSHAQLQSHTSIRQLAKDVGDAVERIDRRE